MTALVVLETVVLAVLTLLAIGLLHSHAAVLRQLRELGGGMDGTAAGSSSRVPASFPRAAAGGDGYNVRGETPDGAPVAVTVVGTGESTLLAFLSSGCSTCGVFWQSLAGAAGPGLPPGTQVVVVTRGPASESVSAVRGHDPAGAPVVMSDEAWAQYRVPGAPYFVLVEAQSGRIVGEGTAENWHELRSLVTHVPPDRRSRVDAELLAAGIGPGHPSLHPEHRSDEGETTS